MIDLVLAAAVLTLALGSILLTLSVRAQRLDLEQLRSERDSDGIPDHGDALLRDRLRERYVVTLLSGETFDGLLASVDERTVVLADASALYADGAKTPVDGELLLRRESIAYLQRP